MRPFGCAEKLGGSSSATIVSNMPQAKKAKKDAMTAVIGDLAKDIPSSVEVQNVAPGDGMAGAATRC